MSDKTPEKPKVWPASADDLGIDEPPVRDDEAFNYLPEGADKPIRAGFAQRPEETQTMPRPLKLGKQKSANAAPTFESVMRIDGELYTFEMKASGPAEFIEGMIVDFSSRFMAQVEKD